jgi:hypothetical protein
MDDSITNSFDRSMQAQSLACNLFIQRFKLTTNRSYEFRHLKMYSALYF